MKLITKVAIGVAAVVAIDFVAGWYINRQVNGNKDLSDGLKDLANKAANDAAEEAAWNAAKAAHNGAAAAAQRGGI